MNNIQKLIAQFSVSVILIVVATIFSPVVWVASFGKAVLISFMLFSVRDDLLDAIQNIVAYIALAEFMSYEAKMGTEWHEEQTGEFKDSLKTVLTGIIFAVTLAVL